MTIFQIQADITPILPLTGHLPVLKVFERLMQNQISSYVNFVFYHYIVNTWMYY